MWERRSARSLVKMLALAPARRLHRERVADLLWPELAAEAADNALRKAVHFARHALEPDLPPRGHSSCLLTTAELISLSPNIWIDVDAFRDAAMAALDRGDAATLTAAAALYGGELLPEDRYESWAEEPREHLARLRLDLSLRLAGALEADGALAAATDALREILTVDPANEAVHRRLMRLYAAEGRRHQAARQYRACREALAAALDAAPEPATTALYRDIMDGAIAVTRPPLSPPALRWPARGPLVGREETRRVLAQSVAEAQQGRGGVVLIGGEAGVGKSRLLADAGLAAHRAGTMVLWGAARDTDASLPYGPVIEALAPVVETWGATIASGRYAALVTLLPGAGPAPDLPPADPDERRARLFATIDLLLDDLGRRRPLLLVLDDLHVADAATLDLLDYLGRRAAGRRRLIAGLYRAGEVPRGSLLQRLGLEAAWCRRLDLACLARPECDRLVAATLGAETIDPALLRTIYTQSLGNPLFVEELLTAMRANGEIVRVDETWRRAIDAPPPVPPSIRDILGARVDRLGPDAGRALGLLAAAGGDSDFGILRATGIMAEGPLLDALDLALDADILEERGEELAFRHPLFRATVYDRLSGPRRRSLHTALATAIAARGSEARPLSTRDVEDLAHHWSMAGDTARAVDCLLEAATRAERVYAFDDALDRLQRARDLLDAAAGVGEASTRAAVLERQGDLLSVRGRTDAALASYIAAAAAGPDGVRAITRLRRKAAHEALMRGRLREAREWLDRAETAANDGEAAEDQRERARLATERSRAHFLAFRFAAALAAAEESARLAERAGAAEELAEALEMAAMACLPLGQWRQGQEYETRGAALATTDHRLRDATDVHLCLADYHLYHRAPAEIARETFASLEAARRAGASRALALCHYYLGTMAYFQGQFTQTLHHQAEAITGYREVGSASGEAMCRLVRGVALTALGRLEDGEADLLTGLDAARRASLRSHAMIRLYAGLGRNRIDANDAAGARQYADAGLALTQEPSTCICHASFLPVATVAYALTGEPARAAALGASARAQAEAFHSPAFLCMAEQANGMADALAGRWAEAFAALDHARALAETHAFPYELARTLLLRSFVHLRRRRPTDLAAATQLTTQATPILVRLGARASLAQTKSSLGFLRGHAGPSAPA